ncbi:MerR family transcriptional regulator [Nocardioides sp. T2.26MG-1]|uniref:MerR family transcriptional regulator n=1 Tax=Nocardioides sp. T2.26MG-1 TaxID=3041166 RepID=UPI0024774DA1|nr:MerR family transcriptional regulator [Nocardioides sp. T2.26MG-1]CAI9413814.1 hypothetical protein HIDPHFAB_02116 [Nocardioides sp. T2.26MG-1]
MRVAEIAELVGTSVRTVRYYHQIGLLPVPDEAGGYRDYDLRHVARLSRIRWLAASGVPLQAIAEMLAHDGQQPVREGVLTDLGATLAAVEEELAELTTRRDRLHDLIGSLRAGGPLSPAPAPVLAFYQEMEGRAPDERTRREVRRERDFVELAYFRGDVPAEAELLYLGLDEAARAASAAAFEGNSTAELTPDVVERIAADNAARIVARFTAGAEQHGRPVQPVDVAGLRRLYDLFAATGTDRERVLGEAVMRHLVAAIEAGGLA